MHNGSLENTVSESHNVHQQCEIENLPQPQAPPNQDVVFINGESHQTNGFLQDEIRERDDNGNDAPPAKKRKLTDHATGKATGQRPISPPWKKIAVDGPTSFVEEGRRKSSRTNYVPIELQPPADKRQTRAAIHGGSPVTKSKYGGAFKSTPLTTSTSIQTQTPTPTPTQAHNYARKPHTTNKPRSPSKARVESSTPSRPSSDAPPPPKRSHKKKVRPTTPTSSTSPSSNNPQQTRRVHRRKSETTTELNKVPGQAVNGWHHEEAGQEEKNGGAPVLSPSRRPPRLNLKVRMPTAHIQHPGNQALPRKFSTFAEWFDEEGRLGLAPEEKDLSWTDNQIVREAQLRTSIARAVRPGGSLSEGRCRLYEPEAFEPPPQQYFHQDRLVAHAIYFQKLLDLERRRHMKTAKEVAEKVASAVREKQEKRYMEWKDAQPKTEEDIAQEQMDAARVVYRQVQEDIKRKWLVVTEMVEAHRLQRWQEEQDRLGKEALNEAIERSKGLLNKRRKRDNADSSSQEDTSHSNLTTESDEGSQDESNMSASQSESEEERGTADDDEGLTQEQLRTKYSLSLNTDVEAFTSTRADVGNTIGTSVGEVGPPLEPSGSKMVAKTDREDESAVNNANGDTFSPPLLDEVDDALLDNSDESTDMEDSDMSGIDESSSEDDSDEDVGEDGDDRGPSNLLGFLGRKEIQAAQEKPQLLEGARIEVDGDDDESDTEKVSLIPDIVQAPTPKATPEAACEKTVESDREDKHYQRTSEAEDREITSKHEDKIVDSKEDEPFETQGSQRPEFRALTEEISLPSTPVSNNAIKTSVPSLLRGTLREYQHFGLDWLAGLYASRTNGILADEMGLGKTIQTIALLAHLAIEHEVWGPHLIVVPTSVMLNWEIEFKKFLPGFKILTYYGTQEERRVKRQGWMDDNKWNVWITSYTIVTKDQQIFKRKGWHYMILDEAHNIKNFQSLRWQTLLTFNTQARLLLTGTPLQNNLTELWSLLFFLTPSDQSQSGISRFADLNAFTDWFRKPVEQIMEHGRETMDAEARDIVAKLHRVLRPFLLRRLKADVEKQMPGKYEHVVYCRLSKRQRYLYDGFMSRAQTRETLASGNTFSIMNALMQLRKVCNHPDLFETRQIVTSFAMPKSAVADFEIKELLVRRRLLRESSLDVVDLNMINLVPGENEPLSALDTIQRQRIGALGALRQRMGQQWSRIEHDRSFDGISIHNALSSYENSARQARYEKLSQAQYLTSLRSQRRPLFSYSLMDQIRRKFPLKRLPVAPQPYSRAQLTDWYSRKSTALAELVLTLPERSASLETIVSKFGFVTPSVVATELVPLTLCRRGLEAVETAKELTSLCDPYHTARMRLSIAFPDKRLLQYDCGKLQRLDALLRTLQAGGHRALIFTQMTKVLDILEQFLNIHGHRYLRLDGATKIEQRQVLTDRFNNDDRILCFILSSRSGGIGINLTGADSVIFYDLDWNPAMDKQCQDRSHRIGQTRDVHIYRLVSEYTIEANILRKANQKRMLDDVVIQEGEFTTDYFNNMSVKEMVGDETFDDVDVDANAAMDRVLGGRGAGRAFEVVEDQEDVAAARAAEKELAQNQDAADFDDRGGANSTEAQTPKTPGPPSPGEILPPARRQRGDIELSTTMEAVDSGLVSGTYIPELYEDVEELPSCDEYMLRFLEWELKDVPVEAPIDKSKKKTKKGKEHGIRKG